MAQNLRKNTTPHPKTQRVSLRDQHAFFEHALPMWNREPSPKFWSDLTDAIRRLPDPPFSKRKKDALIAWHTMPPPHSQQIEDLARRLTTDLLRGQYTESSDSAIVRFRELFLKGEKIGWEQRVGIATMERNMRVLCERWEKDGDKHALAVALHAYDVAVGGVIEDPADIPEEWIRRGLGRAGREILPITGTGSGRTKKLSSEQEKEIAAACKKWHSVYKKLKQVFKPLWDNPKYWRWGLEDREDAIDSLIKQHSIPVSVKEVQNIEKSLLWKERPWDMTMKRVSDESGQSKAKVEGIYRDYRRILTSA